MLLVSFREGRRNKVAEEAGVALGSVSRHLLSDWESSQRLAWPLSGSSQLRHLHPHLPGLQFCITFSLLPQPAISLTGSEPWTGLPPPTSHLVLMSTARVGGGLVFQLPPSLEGGVDPPSPPLTMTDTVTHTHTRPATGLDQGLETNFYCKTGTFESQGRQTWPLPRHRELESSPFR